MVMAFLQHENANLAIATTDFWTLLIKEALVGPGDQKADSTHGGRKLLAIPDGFLAALLDVVVLRLQKPVLDSLEDYPAEFYDSAKVRPPPSSSSDELTSLAEDFDTADTSPSRANNYSL